jgi:(p)ppGpp synthase/HD superfamily hydrolase
MAFSARIERAINACITAHHGQRRKGDATLHYSVHPIHMALILARVGVSDTVIEGALLHDTVEDCEDWTLERVREEFGEAVAEVVDHLTEEKRDANGDELPWEVRKRAAVEQIRQMPWEAAAVKAADKLHNMNSLVEQLEAAEDPAAVWRGFKGGAEGTLRVAREVLAALQAREGEPVPSRLLELLGAAVERVARHANEERQEG